MLHIEVAEHRGRGREGCEDKLGLLTPAHFLSGQTFRYEVNLIRHKISLRSSENTERTFQSAILFNEKLLSLRKKS